MSEPIYEEDSVNLGYLNKRLKEVSEDINLPENISRHYASKPQPPYYKGDTWIDGSIVYTCINSRDIGLYTDSDWVTESGAKAEAESKNKTYLEQPSNYSVGDTWILQSDNDHKAGKKGEILITTVGRKDYNEDDWVNNIGYGSIEDINKIEEDLKKVEQDLDIVTTRTTSITTDLGTINQRVVETTTVADKLTGEVETINQEIGDIKSDHEKWVANFEKRGGNNLFSYDLDLWNSYSGIKEYSETEIIANSVSGKGYLIGSGTSVQEINVQNGTYTVSFKYKKTGPALAITIVKVNDEEYPLNETEWTDFVKTIEITTNHIKIEFTSDTNDSLYVTDLLATLGSEKQIWTQNPNEIRTDTVTIGKGIKVESTEKNTVHTIGADGNRTYNKNTGELVAELTDKGLEAEEIISRGQAQISGILIQQQGNQTWISSLL